MIKIYILSNLGVISIFRFMNIEAERVRNGMTKDDFSRFLGISLRTYYNWQKGESPIPHTALAKMKKKFGKDIDYLLEENEIEQDAG